MFQDKRCAPCCMSNCNCHEPLKWWDEDISLDSLEQLCVKHIWGECEGKRLIYFIMRNSKVLKKITVVFSSWLCSYRRFLRNLRKLSTSGCTIELNFPCREISCYSGMETITVTKAWGVPVTFKKCAVILLNFLSMYLYQNLVVENYNPCALFW